MAKQDESEKDGADQKPTPNDISQQEISGPLAIDIPFIGESPTPPGLPHPQYSTIFQDWPVKLTALCTFLSGIAGVVQPLFLRLLAHPKLFSILVPYGTYHWSKAFTVSFGMCLIYLALNLFHRKRMAWAAALLMNILSCLIQFARIGSERIPWLADNDWAASLPAYSCMPALLALVVLIAFRKRFTVQSEITSIKQAFIIVCVLILATLAYGTLGFWLLDQRDFGLQFQIGDALLRTLREFFWLGNPDLVAHTRYAHWFLDALHVSGALALALSAFSLFRPISYRLSTMPREHAQARSILERYGNSSLDSYKLLDDKSYLFSASGDGFIAYKTALSVAIVLGDPVGPPYMLPELTMRFLDMCHNNGWSVAFLQVSPNLLSMYERLKLNILKVGEDGVVDLEQYAKTTVNKKTFKSVVRKLDKEGYKLVRHLPPHSEKLLDEMQAVSDEWLSLPGRRERTFSLGTFHRPSLQETPIFALQDPSGQTIAFVNQVRSYKQGETTIDLMRHRVKVPNGAMDFLFAKLLLTLKEEGFTHFSLGLAALSGVGETPHSSPEEKAIYQIYQHMNRFFSYKGLRAYKAKFDPAWEDRFLIYEGGPPKLIRTALAIAKATEE